jgi:hypothetical protein
MIEFPTRQNRDVNMMPFIKGETGSIPKELHDFLPIIESIRHPSLQGQVCYLTIRETERGAQKKSRGGVHTERWAWPEDKGPVMAWGGNQWGREHIYLANSVRGSCGIFFQRRLDDDEIGVWGDASHIKDLGPESEMFPNIIYRIGDNVPHRAIPTDEPRTMFRLVGPELGSWFAAHSTPNPLGVPPGAPILNTVRH